MSTPERSPERDRAIEAMLPYVAREGWTVRALRSALGDAGEADLLFPGGNVDMIEAFSDLADRKMRAEAERFAGLRISERVRAILALRLEQNRDAKEAVRPP